MNTAVQHVLESFDRLPDPDKQQVAAEIIRRLVHIDFPPLSDEDLLLSAEELFLELDRQESEHE
jgi:hypothetical protein